MADYRLLAQYPKQQVVRDRNYSGLLAWAAYVTAEAIPTTKPDPEWVRERVVAEQLPLQTNVYVDRTMSYFMQDPNTGSNLSAFMNQWNDDTTENTLSDQVSAIISAFMPRFAASDVNDATVQAWYDAHGFGAPPV